MQNEENRIILSVSPVFSIYLFFPLKFNIFLFLLIIFKEVIESFTLLMSIDTAMYTVLLKEY